MTAWLNQRLAQSLQETVAAVRSEAGAKLCCETGGLDSKIAVACLSELVCGWGRDLLLCFIFRGSQWRAVVACADEIESLLHGSLATEEVVTLVDLVCLGGCTIDFSPESEGTVEVLIAAWGSHEAIATEFDERFPGQGTFRGN